MTNDAVTFDGRWHKITDAGINPLPVQQPIPVWFGGRAEQTLKRVGTIGDGWFPLFKADDEGRALVERMRGYARDAGRDASSIGIESWISVGNGSPEDWADQAKAWQELGATHLSINTMKAGFKSVNEHIEAVKQANEVIAGI